MKLIMQSWCLGLLASEWKKC